MFLLPKKNTLCTPYTIQNKLKISIYNSKLIDHSFSPSTIIDKKITSLVIVTK